MKPTISGMQKQRFLHQVLTSVTYGGGREKDLMLQVLE